MRSWAKIAPNIINEEGIPLSQHSGDFGTDDMNGYKIV
jgi:hypothetical protein